MPQSDAEGPSGRINSSTTYIPRWHLGPTTNPRGIEQFQQLARRGMAVLGKNFSHPNEAADAWLNLVYRSAKGLKRSCLLASARYCDECIASFAENGDERAEQQMRALREDFSGAAREPLDLFAGRADPEALEDRPTVHNTAGWDEWREKRPGELPARPNYDPKSMPEMLLDKNQSASGSGADRMPGDHGADADTRKDRMELAPQTEPNPDSAGAKLKAKLAALPPDERAKLEAAFEDMAREVSSVAQASSTYQTNLLRRLGVRTKIDDFEEFYVQLQAAAEYVGISPDRFWDMTPRELCAVLEHRATELEMPRPKSQSERWEAPKAIARRRKRRVRKSSVKARNKASTTPAGSLEGDTRPFSNKNSVTFPEAEAYLGIGSRQRQKLMKQGKLDVIGEGLNKRITVASVTRYRPPTEKSNRSELKRTETN